MTVGGRATAALDDPVLNGPYDEPSRYFEIGPKGPTGQVLKGRRPSESFVPVAPVKKRGRQPRNAPAQVAYQGDQLQLALQEEIVQQNTLINGLRRDVQVWRTTGYPHVTSTSLKLLRHWADSRRDNRILFAQREAVETAIFLAEVSGRRAGFRDWRPELDDQNAEHNEGLPRVALKMATGTGKTVVMAMLIAWQTLNKVARPSDARFAKRFLVVAPGITIRDRLRVLQPNDPGNYYDARGIVPAGLRGLLGKAQILVVNYHAFLLRDRKEIRGVASMTRKILLGGAADDPFKETEADMVSRVLRGWGVGTGRQSGEIVVLNDEAHHCYMDKPITLASQMQGVEEGDKSEKKEIERRNEDARAWFKGLRAISEKVGIKTVYDLSATPFYLSGSGYKDGFIFPWTVSDFSLMDAIECGIVKVPRVPVDDNSAGDVVTFRNLWSAVEKKLPKRGRANTALAETPVLPVQLEAALHSLHRSYTTAFEHWEKELAPLEEPPPVFIVVCPNTATSKLMYDWIAGREIARENDTPLRIPGSLELFSNIVADRALGRPRTILIDSAQLESGEALSADFKAAAATEIETFKADYRLRNPGADVNALTDEDLLREVMNTVGKKGQLGAEVRCVVSVSMLTEGWDANTVTHILGVRAFRSQLLCEQVVGRGLRRRSYAVNEDGRFDAEYANVYGVPFAFIPTDKPVGPPKPPTPAVAVHTVPGREHLRITFPHVEGYRLEIPDEELYLPDDLPPFVIGKGRAVPTWTEVAPAVGEPELVKDEAVTVRPRTVAYRLARRLVQTHFALGEVVEDGGVKAEPRPWLFPALLRVSTKWVERAVNVEAGFSLGYLAKYATWEAAAADALYAAINMQQGERRARIRPILRRYDPVGSTGNVSFPTRKATLVAQPDRSEISHVVLDGVGGNTWEQLAKEYCEHAPHVHSYAKNDHLGFSIPYVHEGRTHDYVPDFLVRLRRRGDDVERTLVVEISGSQKDAFMPGLPELKATTARDSWCAAVNNHGGFGRWGYVEVTNPLHLAADLDAAIEALYADQPIIGDPDLLDLRRT